MLNIIYQLIRTARPRQWLKNLSLFAAPLFSGYFFIDDKFWPTFNAFLAFCALSSGIYFINDLVDIEKDKKHPIKSNRPLASGKLPKSLAIVVAGLLVTGSVVYSIIFVGQYFTAAVLIYIVTQILYSFYFRNVIILDSLVVGSGFIIRVFAGGLASYTSVSSWLILTTIGISLLLAFGKRRSEKTILAKFQSVPGKSDTRATLRHYPDNLLDSMITMSATYAIITYSLFAFQFTAAEVPTRWMGLFPSILRSPKWLMLTIPLVIYGVARYLYIIYEKGEAESPERVLLSDKPILFTVVLWGLTVMGIIYLLPMFG